MKTIVALAAALMIGSAYAQENDTHMIESNVDSLVRGKLSFDRSKTSGEDADNDTLLDLTLNYAYKLPMHDQLQVGGRLNYLKDTAAVGEREDYGFEVGAFWNFKPQLTDSVYVSLFFGPQWSQFKGDDLDDQELWTTTAALGKRWELKRWNIAHLTYTPEVAFVSENYTTGTQTQFSQSLELRFLQFSLFF